MRSRVFGFGWAVFMGRLGMLLLFPVVVGCGAGHGKVSGRVLCKEGPLPGGQVTFRPADPTHNSVSAEIDEKGNYEAVLPAGQVKVSIDNRYLEPRNPSGGGVPRDLPPELRRAILKSKKEPAAPGAGEKAPAKQPNGKYVPLPSKYYDVETSGLDFKVERGAQTHDFELSK